MKIEYRICDKCKCKIDNKDETYNELTVVESGEKQKLGAWYPVKIQKDLCKNCYKNLLKFLREEKRR
jgi:hypothetical protein